MKLLNIADIYNILSAAKTKDVFYFEDKQYRSAGLRKYLLNFPKTLFSMTGNVLEAVGFLNDDSAVRQALAEHKMSLYVIYIKGEANEVKHWYDNGNLYKMKFDDEGYCLIYVGQTTDEVGKRFEKHLSFAKNFGKSRQSKSPLPRFLHWIDRDKIAYAVFDDTGKLSEKVLYERLSCESDLLNDPRQLSSTPFVIPTKNAYKHYSKINN